MAPVRIFFNKVASATTEKRTRRRRYDSTYRCDVPRTRITWSRSVKTNHQEINLCSRPPFFITKIIPRRPARKIMGVTNKNPISKFPKIFPTHAPTGNLIKSWIPNPYRELVEIVCQNAGCKRRRKIVAVNAAKQ